MPVRFLSDAELARLSGWPESVADEDLVTFFTLTADDVTWLSANVRPENRLGFAVQLCTLPWLGWIPDELIGCPLAAVGRLADRLAIAEGDVAGLLSSYGGWEGRTRRDHRALVLARLGWRTSSAGDRKQLDVFLFARELEHDAPSVLIQFACDWLRSERIVRPSVDVLSRRVAAARDGARTETYHRLAPLLAAPRPTALNRLLEVDDELGMTDLERVLSDPASDGLARVGADGDLIVSPLPAEQAPAEGTALAEAVAARLPQIHLPELLIEVDRDTRFSEAFTHAGGAQPRNPDLIRNLYASVLAYACNLGYAGMADASGISADTLAWTSQWYLRQDTLREANARLVNAHHAHPLARLWGGGTLSSSDGQRFPQRGRSLTARALSRYFLDEGTTTYTHVSDQHSTYGTKVIPTTWREAVAVLDEIFGNPTDLPIAEHTTDTAGQTLATFAIFNLAGLQFSPRIRDIGRLQLYRLGAGSSWRARYPHAGQLLTQPIQTQLIADHWNDLLRLVGSMKFGHTTASLLIAKLHASSRQNSLARACRSTAGWSAPSTCAAMSPTKSSGVAYAAS